MPDNSYAPPRAELDTIAGSCPIYSPNQLAAGAFLGGPVGLIYFLRANFLILNEEEFAKKSLICGAALIIALLVILPLLPEKFPSLPFTIAYVIIGQQIANKFQLTRAAIDASPHYTAQSNWRVFGRGMLCLLGSMIVIFTPIFLFSLVGSSLVR